MANPRPEYDAAISFLASDEETAAALYRQLTLVVNGNHDVIVYTRIRYT